MTRPHLIRPAYFLWVPAALGLYAAYAAFGLPHVLFSYSFDVPAGGDPWSFKDRWYTRCTFVGPYGVLGLCFTARATREAVNEGNTTA